MEAERMKAIREAIEFAQLHCFDLEMFEEIKPLLTLANDVLEGKLVGKVAKKKGCPVCGSTINGHTCRAKKMTREQFRALMCEIRERRHPTILGSTRSRFAPNSPPQTTASITYVFLLTTP